MACPAPAAAPGCLASADGDSTRVRVRVQDLANAGALDRDKQPPVVSRLTGIVAAAAGDPSLADRTGPCPPKPPTADGAWPATPPPTPSSPKAGTEIASLQPRTGN